MLIGGYDQRAVDYIHTCLAAGSTLAKKLSEKEMFTDEITGLLPNELQADRKHDFKVGGISGKGWSSVEANSELTNIVYKYLDSSQSAVAVIENREMALDSRLLTNLSYVHFHDEIYLLLDKTQDTNRGLRTLKAGTRYPFIMILTEDSVKRTDEHNSIEASVLEHWTREANHIIVGVYDEESYLLWNRI